MRTVRQHWFSLLAAFALGAVFLSLCDKLEHVGTGPSLPLFGHVCLVLIGGVVGVVLAWWWLRLREALGRAEAHQESLEQQVESRAAEAELAAERFRNAFAYAPIGMALTAPDGHYLEVNEVLAATLGYARDELRTRHFSTVTHPDEQQRNAAAFKRIASGEVDEIRSEKRYVHKDGHNVWAELTCRLQRDKHGRPEYVITQAVDVTDRKHAERTLGASEERFRTLVVNAPIGVYRTTREGRILDANPALLQMVGYSSFEELAQRNLQEDGFGPEYDRRAFCERLEREGVIRGLEGTWRRRDGTTVHVRENAAAVRDGDGRIICYDGTAEDMTDRKRTEDLLRLERDLGVALGSAGDLTKAFDYLLEATLQIDTLDCGGVYLVDGQTGNMDLVAYRGVPLDFVRTISHVAADSRFATLVNNGQPVYGLQYELLDTTNEIRRRESVRAIGIIPVHHEGRVVAALVLASHTHDEIAPAARHALEAIAAQIGGLVARVRAEASLRESQKKSEEELRRQLDELFAIFNSMESAVYIADMETYEVLAVNKYAEEDGGPGLVGKKCYAQFQAGQTGPCDFCTNRLLVGRDGTPNPPVVWEFQNTKSKRWYQCNDRAIRWPDGRLVRMEIAIDITDRRRAEAERAELESQLRQSQKLEAVGQLAGGVAHDFNNILTAILGNTEVVRDHVPKECACDEVLLTALQQIERAAQRAAALTNRLLMFGRRQVVRPETVDLNAVLGEMKSMLRRVIHENIWLEVVPGPGLHRVRVDVGQIEQVVMNLVVNARDAMPTGGALTLEATNVDLNEAYVAMHPGARPGAHVVLTIRDDGCGMSPPTMEHIFEPFFTTKPVGQGTGLGLATVYGIVQQSGGHVTVESEPGKGATFRVYLPAVAPQPSEPRSDSRLESAAGGHETILVCEDDASVRVLVSKSLKRAGYRVITAENGGQALELVAQYGGPIDMLVTDVVMPGMNGRVLADRMTAAYPTLRTLFISGYPAHVVAPEGNLGPGVELLQKPFSGPVLQERVRAVLDCVRQA